MNGEVEPIIGNWYKRVDKGQAFTVVGLDEEEGVIEIQLLNGEVEEIEAGAWAEMELESIEEPEEWRGALEGDDDVDYEDEDLDDWDENDEEDWRDDTSKDEGG